MSSGKPDQDDTPPKIRVSLPEELERLRNLPDAFRDESLAPEVDRDLLLALVRRQLSEDDSRLLYRLIYSFRSWNEAHAQVLIEEFQRRQQQG